MIYDTFMFFNELEILKIRLSELYDTVDQFVIVEAPLTHKGDPKPMYFADNLSQFSAWMDKIRYITIQDLPRDASGPRETNWNDGAYKREFQQMDKAMPMIG